MGITAAEEEIEEERINLIFDTTFERLDLSNRATAKTKSSLEDPPTLDLKTFLAHLKCTYLAKESTLLVIISSALNPEREKSLLQILKKYVKAIGCTLADIRRINPLYCMHKIRLEEGKKVL